jgi:hypothetical protein
MNKFIRNCPVCNKELIYSNKYSFQSAEIKKSKCRSCGIKQTITEERQKQMSNRVKGENNPMYGMYGNLNPFFGKKHTEESKKKIFENRDMSVYSTDDFKEKMSKVTKGKNNPMFGRSVYSVWIEKHGKEIANEKMIKLKVKQSLNSSGEKNPMYGKPSPVGSGNGWSGWYKGWFFRSLKELSYMINVIERFNLNWESAETKELTIEYFDFRNNQRTYTADFLIEGRYLVEVKPKNLWKSDLVKRKQNSALVFCEKNNLKYKIRDIQNLDTDTIINLYENGVLRFTDRYDKKFKNLHNLLGNS